MSIFIHTFSSFCCFLSSTPLKNCLSFTSRDETEKKVSNIHIIRVDLLGQDFDIACGFVVVVAVVIIDMHVRCPKTFSNGSNKKSLPSNYGRWWKEKPCENQIRFNLHMFPFVPHKNVNWTAHIHHSHYTIHWNAWISFFHFIS